MNDKDIFWQHFWISFRWALGCGLAANLIVQGILYFFDVGIFA